jgi:DHA1 family bicyclomycin/chloramphenicol resistance-like MFS transporter
LSPDSPEPPATPQARAPIGDRTLLGLLAAISALGPIATNLYLPALPDVRADFAASVAAVQTTFSISLITFATGILVWGPISDRYGRRTAVMTGLVIMIAGTLTNLLAPTLGWLIAGRGIQAFGTAAGLVVARAIVTDRMPVDRIARTLASLTMVSVLANALAPTGGGYLVAAFGWRAVFAVLALGATVVAVTAWRKLPETRVLAGRPPGAGAMLRTARWLLRQPLFVHCVLQSTVVYSIFFVFISLVPHVMVEALGRGSTAFGPYYLLIATGFFLGNWSVGRLASPRGQHWMISVGLTIQLAAAVLGLALVLLHVDHPLAIFVPMGILSYGQGLTLPSVTATGVSLTQHHVGVASSIIGFVPQIIGAMALQAMGHFPTDTALPMMVFSAVVSVVGYVVLLAGPRLELTRGPVAGPASLA